MKIKTIKKHLNNFKIESLNLNPEQLQDFIKRYFKTFDKNNTFVKLEIENNSDSDESKSISLIIILYGISYTNWLCNEFIKMLMNSENYKLHISKYNCKYNNISYNHILKIQGEFY